MLFLWTFNLSLIVSFIFIILYISRTEQRRSDWWTYETIYPQIFYCFCTVYQREKNEWGRGESGTIKHKKGKTKCSFSSETEVPNLERERWKEKKEQKGRKKREREKMGGDFEGVLEFRRQGKKKKGQQWLER